MSEREILTSQITTVPMFGPRGGYRFVVDIAVKDLLRTHSGCRDLALFLDIDTGPESDTPLADQLLKLETIVRRIEEDHRRRATS